MNALSPVTVVGPGRLGTTLAVALARGHWPGVLLSGRSGPALTAAAAYGPAVPATRALQDVDPSAATWIIAVSDDAIADVAGRLVADGRILDGAVVLHLSGAHSSRALEVCRQAGAATGSLHPLQTFPDPGVGLEVLPGSHWFAEGDDAALGRARHLVDFLAGHFHVIETGHKVLYHAAAVFASNYLTCVLGASLQCAEAAGLDPGEILPALAPLSRAALEAAVRSGPGQSLTGPLSRGDAATVGAHLEALGERPELARLYRALAEYTVGLALSAGRLDDAAAARVRSAVGGSEGPADS